MSVLQEFYDGDHAEVAAVLTNLADALRISFQHDEVVRFANRSVITFADKAKLRTALAMLERAARMRERVHDGDHMGKSYTLRSIAQCLYCLQRIDESLSMQRDALAMLERLQAGTGRHIASVLANVGQCLNQLGRNAEALEMHKTSIQMHIDHNSADDNIALGKRMLGETLLSLNRQKEAKATFYEAYNMSGRATPTSLGMDDATSCGVSRDGRRRNRSSALAN